MSMRYVGVGRTAAKAQSGELLAMVGLEDQCTIGPASSQAASSNASPIAGARADPPLIVADEPTRRSTGRSTA